jgi:hypothetical protein
VAKGIAEAAKEGRENGFLLGVAAAATGQPREWAEDKFNPYKNQFGGDYATQAHAEAWNKSFSDGYEDDALSVDHDGSPALRSKMGPRLASRIPRLYLLDLPRGKHPGGGQVEIAVREDDQPRAKFPGGDRGPRTHRSHSC